MKKSMKPILKLILILCSGSIFAQQKITYFTYEASSVHTISTDMDVAFDNIDRIDPIKARLTFSFSQFKSSNVDHIQFTYEVPPEQLLDFCEFGLVFMSMDNSVRITEKIDNKLKSGEYNLNTFFDRLGTNEMYVQLEFVKGCFASNFDQASFYFSRKQNSIDVGPKMMTAEESKANFIQYQQIFLSEEAKSIFDNLNPDIKDKDSLLSNYPFKYVEIPRFTKAQRKESKRQLKVAKAYNKSSIALVKENFQKLDRLSDSILMDIKSGNLNGVEMKRLAVQLDTSLRLGNYIKTKQVKIRHTSSVYLNEELDYIIQNVRDIILNKNNSIKPSIENILEVILDLNEQLKEMNAYFERKSPGSVGSSTGNVENQTENNAWCGVESGDELSEMLVTATYVFAKHKTAVSQGSAGNYSNAIVQLKISNYDCAAVCSTALGSSLKATLVPYGFRFDNNAETPRNLIDARALSTSPAFGWVGIGKYYLRLFNLNTKKEIEFLSSESHTIDLTTAPQIKIEGNKKYSFNFPVRVKK